MASADSVIREEILHHGVISFARFMELALYHPECGYYQAHPRTIGRSGDYFTSVSVGEIFGELVASHFTGLVKGSSSSTFQWVECGAHDGRFAADVLTWLERTHPEVLHRLTYIFLEPSPIRRQWQSESVRRWGERVQWVSHFGELPPVTGIIFSNELLDAMPVHRFSWDAVEPRWVEWGVTIRGDALDWTPLACPSFPVLAAMEASGLPLTEELLAILPHGYVLEISPAAIDWWSKAAGCLQWGQLMAFDYGFTAEEGMRPERTGGTLRGYLNHRVTDQLLANPGGQDLTAHVNFSALQRAGESAGLRTEGLWRQGDFLTRVTARGLQAGLVLEWTSQQRRQFQTLVHPEHLGRSFRVLVQSRGLQDR